MCLFVTVFVFMFVLHVTYVQCYRFVCYMFVSLLHVCLCLLHFLVCVCCVFHFMFVCCMFIQCVLVCCGFVFSVCATRCSFVLLGLFVAYLFVVISVSMFVLSWDYIKIISSHKSSDMIVIIPKYTLIV